MSSLGGFDESIEFTFKGKAARRHKTPPERAGSEGYLDPPNEEVSQPGYLSTKRAHMRYLDTCCDPTRPSYEEDKGAFRLPQ